MFDGSKGVSTIMTTSKNRVKPSPTTDLWRLKGAFNTGIVLDTYMAVDTVQRTLHGLKITTTSDLFGDN